MKIGFVGAGNIGQALAGDFVAVGHEVALSNSRGPDTLADVVAPLGAAAQAVTREEAIAFGDVVVVTIPLGNIDDLPADAFAGKTVIDTCNYYPERAGQIAELDDGSLTTSELVARALPEAKVVKAFNSIYFKHLAEQGDPSAAPGTRRGIPVAADDPAAKQLVEGLIDEIGFDAVDAGPLSAGRDFENGTELYGAELTGDALAAALGHSSAPG